jgi:glycosyltransferase involved in cell wall biosynthesis
LRGRAAARLCDALVSVSADCAGKIAAACGRPVRAILNGSSALPSESHAALRAELGVPDGVPLIGAIANLEARKGLRALLDAFARLPRPDARLVVIGADAEPEESSALKDLAAAPALAGRVLLAGYRPNARRYAAAFDVCVVPSLRQESFGLLALDAMRAGRPVVATRVGGLPEVVDDGVTGLLVPPGDPAALAAALERLLADPGLARGLGEAGRRRAAERFDAARMAAEYREVLLGNAKC